MNPSRSHIPVLSWLAKRVPIHTVLELGPGNISTPIFLDERTFPHLQRLVSVEDNQWYARTLQFDDYRWDLRVVSYPEFLETCSLDYDLIFVDNDTTVEGRAKTIQTLAERQPRGVVVIHDYERDEYQKAAESFPHRVVYDADPQHVAVVSFSPLPV